MTETSPTEDEDILVFDMNLLERDRLFNLSLDLLCIGGFDGLWRQLNPAWEKTLGFSSDELKGRPFLDFVHPDDREAMRELTTKLKDGGETLSLDNRHLAKDGSYVWLSWSMTSALRKRLFYGVARNITERRKADEELAQQAKELARSNSDLEQFAYVASHDLQEPLRMVASYVQLLARRYRGKLDADADEFIAFAVDGATRMQGLITDLLAYSRVGRQGKDFAQVNAEEVLGRALSNLGLALADSQGRVTHDPLPTLWADGRQLSQLFQNLVANELKFRGDLPPHVHVTARREGSDWRFAVADNGIGIAKEYSTRIFAIFQRLHTRREYPGTGIGLAICKKIVEYHDGRIWVESEPGHGATFHFTIPAGEEA